MLEVVHLVLSGVLAKWNVFFDVLEVFHQGTSWLIKRNRITCCFIYWGFSFGVLFQGYWCLRTNIFLLFRVLDDLVNFDLIFVFILLFTSACTFNAFAFLSALILCLASWLLIAAFNLLFFFNLGFLSVGWCCNRSILFEGYDWNGSCKIGVQLIVLSWLSDDLCRLLSLEWFTG